MPNPSDIYAASVLPGAAELHEAVILDDASAIGDQVRCTITVLGPGLTTDPCDFNPVSRPAGWFYPKKGNRAIVAMHGDGPDSILEWWPAIDAEPDHAA